MILTPREKEVCTFLVYGCMNKEIAGHLGLSPRTVEEYRRKLYRKFEVRSSVELVRAVYGIKGDPLL